MTRTMLLFRRAIFFCAAVSLSACGQATSDTNLAALDEDILANDVDPALTSALEDQILVDPALSQQANRNAVRPPETPTQAQYPLPGAAGESGASFRRASAQHGPTGVPGCTSCPAGGRADMMAGVAQGASASCGANFEYGPAWADRLPPAFPPYPGGRVTEAAGNDAGSCRLRVVAFGTGDDAGRVIEWYRGQAVRAGYSAEQQRRGEDLVLGGVNERDGGAFYLIVTPKGQGAEVALIVNNGI